MSDGEHLAPRLREVGRLLAEAKTKQEIADALSVELHTAEKYVSDPKTEVGARDRVELALWCKEKLGSGLP